MGTLSQLLEAALRTGIIPVKILKITMFLRCLIRENEVRKVFDNEPSAVLHMTRMLLLEEGMSFEKIQGQLEVAATGSTGLDLISVSMCLHLLFQ